MVIEAGRQKKQRRLYPPERYPVGFSPPEVFDPEEAVGGESDLYSWAALAYFLITGERPTSGRHRRAAGPAVRPFEDAHFARLEGELAEAAFQQLAARAEGLPDCRVAFRPHLAGQLRRRAPRVPAAATGAAAGRPRGADGPVVDGQAPGGAGGAGGPHRQARRGAAGRARAWSRAWKWSSAGRPASCRGIRRTANSSPRGR